MAPIRQKASGSRRQTPIVRDSGKGTSSKLSYNATPLAPSSKPSTTNSSPLTSTSTRSSRPTGLFRSTPYDRPVDPRPKRLTLNDLECVRTLGKGSYGRVVLVRTHEDSTIPELPHGAQFAMKAISKKGRHHRQRGNKEPREHSKRIKDSRNAERRFLAELPWHPFINGIMDAFDDDRNLYLMLELAPCESLHKYLRRKRDPIPSAHARFYFSNIVLGLEFLHSRDIVHRDLKPGNILMGADGYLMIGDFGCATHISEGGRWQGIGTRFYMAPEVNSAVRTTPEACHFIDWWAAAVILYEMVTDRHPFKGPEHEQVYAQCLVHNIQWPAGHKANQDLKDLVERMLIPDPAERYGCMVLKGEHDEVGKNDEVRIHPFCYGKVNWKKIMERRQLAPYVPAAYPDLTAAWHTDPMPVQEKVPGIQLAQVPLEYQYDSRLHHKHDTQSSSTT